MASAWARTEPENAAAWALAHARPEEHAHPDNLAVNHVFLRWVNNAPDAAHAWWRALPPSPLRDALGASVSTYVAESGELDLALEMIKPGVSEADGDVVAQLGQILAQRDPMEAGSWLATLPTATKTKFAADLIVQSMYSQDPEAVARFIEDLPAGRRRDEVAAAFVHQAARSSPGDAAEWVLVVEDPALRQAAAIAVYTGWRDREPAAAQAWIRNLEGVDPEWHARFVRMMR